MPAIAMPDFSRNLVLSTRPRKSPPFRRMIKRVRYLRGVSQTLFIGGTHTKKISGPNHLIFGNGHGLFRKDSFLHVFFGSRHMSYSGSAFKPWLANAQSRPI